MSTSPIVSPSLTITRTIHPVGQGAFYSETFSAEGILHPVFTAVYDCGGLKQNCVNEIKTLKRLDAVFISHFHNDHVKCIPDLMKVNPNAYIFIPGISHRQFIVDFISIFCKSYGSDLSSIQFMLKCVPVLRSPNKVTNKLQLQVSLDVAGTPSGTSSGSIIAVRPTIFEIILEVDTYNWCYDAYFNDYDTSKEVELIEKMAGIIHSLKGVLTNIDEYRDVEWYEKYLMPELADLLETKGGLERIKTIYKSVFQNKFNHYSMTVHSHSENMTSKKRIDCMFTGDIEPSDGFSAIVQKLKPRYVQVPHHGSSNNHNTCLYQHHPSAFISVGENNGFGHPGVHAIADILKKCRDVYVVTESKNTRYKRRFKL